MTRIQPWNTAIDWLQASPSLSQFPGTSITILATARQIVWFQTAFRSRDDSSLTDLDMAAVLAKVSPTNLGPPSGRNRCLRLESLKFGGFVRHRVC
jgi:hypothetical protein